MNTFPLDAHGKSAKFLKDTRSATCEACHGNSDRHAETSTRTKAGEGTVNPAKLTSAQSNETCLQCHSRDRTHFEWRGGKHDRKDMSCLSCHSAHHTQLLKTMAVSLTDKSESEVAEILNTRLPEHMLVGFSTEETCLSCHNNRRADFFKRSTHLFRTELRNMKVGCTSCHNPHGGEGGKMLVNHTVNNVCYTCHAEKRGPFLWDHPPVRENCLNCHSPHGSNNPKLLTARVGLLCQQCHIHMLPRHSTTAGKPLDIWTINRGCSNCHGQVHGSNHPGG
ncbi:MAG: cytochrome C [Blastocatellia bacterium]|nr:cytochrome C [Blastocatellia bacterium]